MYVCGPTVYNRIHIGNARTFISFDIIRRYLEWRGYDVTFVQNVTDVDDKIIKRACEEGRSAEELACEYTQLFIDDMHRAGVADPTIRPRATQEIDTMIELIERLIEGGYAYVSDGDVYFAVRTYNDYGKLSGRNIDDAQAGHRELRGDEATTTETLKDRKRDPLDFALWKTAKMGEPAWDSPWGAGRPGWHIECSAMSHKYLGTPFDIHGGGSDLIFPHHENECAQAQAAYGCTFANHWMHSGMLQIANADTGEVEKMSKSLNNFLLLHEALDIVRPEALRMLMLQTHYRSPLVFGDARLSEANAALTRIETAVKNVDWMLGRVESSVIESEDGAGNSEGVSDGEGATGDGENTHSSIDADALNRATQIARDSFTDSMDDDFNAPLALGAIFTLVTELNSATTNKILTCADVPAVKNARDTIVELMGCFGIDVAGEAESSRNANIGTGGQDANSNANCAGAGASAGEADTSKVDAGMADDGAHYPDAILTLAQDITGYDGSNKADAAQTLLDARAKARAEKNWDVADSVRDGLTSLGFKIEDTPQGARVSFEG